MKINLKQINICNFYLALWVLYAIHWLDADVPFVEAISNIILGINLAISIFYTIDAWKNYRLPKIYKAINLLILWFTIYGLVYIIFGPTRFYDAHPVKRGTYLISFLRSFLPIYVFYVFTLKGWLTQKTIQVWVLIFLGCYIYIYSRSIIVHSLISENSEFVNNTGYLFAVLLASVFLFKDKLLVQIAFIGICFFFIVMALKRGAMICAALVILMFIYYRLKDASNSHKFIIFTAIAVALIFAYEFVADRIIQSEAFQNRIEETMAGNVSLRDVLARTFLNYYFNNYNILEQLFGGGADVTLSISFNWAHNDWIEILMCQGFVGVIIYAVFWLSFYKQWRRMKVPMAKHIVGSIFIVYFFRTFVSMSYSMIFTVASMSLGYALAVNQIYTVKRLCRR